MHYLIAIETKYRTRKTRDRIEIMIMIILVYMINISKSWRFRLTNCNSSKSMEAFNLTQSTLIIIFTKYIIKKAFENARQSQTWLYNREPYTDTIPTSLLKVIEL